MAAEKTDKLQEGIAYFEQILQIMPDDRSTLEFLCIAYRQTGEREKYLQTLVTLARTLVNERDFESAKKLLESLDDSEDAEAKAVALRIRGMLSRSPNAQLAAVGTGSRTVTGATPAVDGRLQAIEAEIKLVSWLESNQIIEKELAEKVSSQLRELKSVTDDLLISALTLIMNENPAVAESASSCLADETKTPPIGPESFDQVLVLAKSLPEELVKTRGVIPFGKIAGETLVALANPMDQALRARVSACFGGRCHFFFAPPTSLGIVMGRLYPEARK